MIELWKGDCLEEMKKIGRGGVSLVLCDLPYGVLHKNNPNSAWDIAIPMEPLWAQYERVIKDDGAIVLFGQGMFTAKMMIAGEKLWRYNLVWDKEVTSGFLNANRMPLRQHEDIMVFYKNLPKYNPQMEIGDLNHPQGKGHHRDTNNCYGKFKTKGFKTGRLYEYKKPVKHNCYGSKNGIIVVPPTHPGLKFPSSIVRFAKERTDKAHPTQKPVALLEWLIKTYTDKGEVVLDNTMGSGSTGVACVNTGRSFIGIEKDDRFFEIAKARIAAAEQEKASRLFDVEEVEYNATEIMEQMELFEDADE